jgi:RNA polymerase sigma-70 factor (ECF subfamily)
LRFTLKFICYRYRQIDAFPESAKGFLYHYLVWRVLDSIRKENFNCIAAATCEPLEVIEEALSYVHVSEEYEFKELESQIESILNGLPEQTAEIFVLHWRKGYSLKEIAGLLQMNEQTVRRKIRKKRLLRLI